MSSLHLNDVPKSTKFPRLIYWYRMMSACYQADSKSYRELAYKNFWDQIHELWQGSDKPPKLPSTGAGGYPLLYVTKKDEWGNQFNSLCADCANEHSWANLIDVWHGDVEPPVSCDECGVVLLEVVVENVES